MFKLDLEKAGEPEVKLLISIGSLKEQESFKNMCFYFTDYAKAFDYVDHKKLGKFSSGHRTGKGQFSTQCQRKAMFKLPHN